MTLPLVPEDIRPRPPFGGGDGRSFIRAVASIAMAKAASDKTTFVDAEAVARERWPRDLTAHQICKAATAPADTLTSGWASQLVTTSVQGFLAGLAFSSAAAKLFTSARLVDLAGVGAVSVPYPVSVPAPPFVGEGSAIPVIQAVFGDLKVGPAAKLAFIAAITGKLAKYSASAAETVVQAAMETAAAAALDGAVFSTTAGSAIRPPGILNGVTPITASTATPASEAMADDLSNLAGAIGDAGGGANLAWFAAVKQATAIQLRAPTFTVTPVPTLADGTVIAVELGGIATGYSGLPEISVSANATLHMEGANPLPIGTPPNVVAAPTRSLWQTDSMALRLILRTAWACAPGMAQVVNGATW